MTIKLKPKILLIEIAILVVVFCCLGIYRFLGLELRDPLILYFQRIGSIFYMYFFMLLVVFFLERVRDIERWRRTKQKTGWQVTWANFRNDYLNIRSVVADIRVLNAVAILFVLIINLRHIIPYVNKTVYDSYFVSLEEFLFGGRILSLWMIDFFGTEAAPLMSNIYRLFYPYLSVIIFTFVLYRNRRLSQQFFISFVMLWIAGIVITCFWPTWGPCFYLPQAFAMLPETTMTQMQQGLWEMKQYLEANPNSAKGAYLISAMPSLHVGVIALGSIYLFRISKIMSCMSWLFVVVTIISTLYFGWHYLVDDIAAIAIAYTVVRFVDVFTNKAMERH